MKWNRVQCTRFWAVFSGNIQTSDGNAFVLSVYLSAFVHKLMLTIYLSWLCARELSIACLIDLFDTHTPFTERNSNEITCIFITSIESCEMRIDWNRRRRSNSTEILFIEHKWYRTIKNQTLGRCHQSNDSIWNVKVLCVTRKMMK